MLPALPKFILVKFSTMPATSDWQMRRFVLAFVIDYDLKTPITQIIGENVFDETDNRRKKKNT